MNLGRVEAVANAILYEGYMLYPYRASALKNRLRWMWGVLAPQGRLSTEFLVRGGPEAEIEIRLRFLRPNTPPLDGGADAMPGQLDFGHAPLGEPAERAYPFEAPPDVTGSLDVSCAAVDDGLYRVRTAVRNLTPPGASGDDQRLSLVSAHLLIGVRGGELVPPRDPPAEWRAAMDACRSEGLWPILAGHPGARDLLLASPIILDDYPEVAPESRGDLFDGTEIDEILTLRLLTLAPAERAELASADERVRALLARVDATTPESLSRLHGTVRAWRDLAARPRPVQAGGRELRPGDRVRLRPRGRSDIFDLALVNRSATVLSVEEDVDGRGYVTVTVDDDPGRDLGVSGFPGHRFFFAPDEIEPLAAEVER